MTREGFWSVRSKGDAGEGVGVIVLDTNMVVGADAAGVVYDGTYCRNNNNELDCEVTATVVNNDVWIVTNRTMLLKGSSFQIKAVLPSEFGLSTTISVNTPFGPIKVSFSKIRDFPVS